MTDLAQIARQAGQRTDRPPADLAPADTSLTGKMQYARLLATSGMLPKQYQGNPANLLYAIEFGQMLGLTPMAAITGVHVIEGKPTASAQLISALVRKAGHRLRVTGDDRQARAEIVRKDDPEHIFAAVWTFERAQRAGLVGKDNWKKYPAQMLKNRAVAEVGRDACSDVLAGLSLADEVEIIEGEVAWPDSTQPEPAADPHTGEISEPEPGHAPEPEPTPPAAPEPPAVPAPTRPATAAQKARLAATLGPVPRDQRLARIGDAVGRAVGSMNELTADEASTAIEVLSE